MKHQTPDTKFQKIFRHKTPTASGVWFWEFKFGVSILFWFWVLVFAYAPSALAQRRPRIGYVYPAGGQAGAAFQVAVGGQFLDGVTRAWITGPGVTATVVEFNKPMGQGQFNQLRDQIREFQERKQAAERDAARGSKNSTNVWTTSDEKQLAELRGRILKNPPNRNGTPAIAEIATMRVRIAADATPGEREIRLSTPAGLSNPLKFCIGQLPEFSDPPARAANPDADRFRERLGRQPTNTASKAESRITLPATVNGQIMPGEADRIRFNARKGQRLVIAASARALIPYLADAVPGWFQATLSLRDAKGRELAYNDDFRFHPDPVLHFEIPRDGEYALEIKDAIYRGREDFIYRITMGELPFVTGLFPLGGRAGIQTTVELQGWNLLQTNLAVKIESAAPAVQSISVRNVGRVSNRLPFAVDVLPECPEQEANNTPATAQKISRPAVVNGRMDQPGDVDVFCFAGRAGDQIVAEVLARRLDSAVDSVLKLTDDRGRQLALNDDHEDRASGLNTHHADSRLFATLPADGNYFVHLNDAQRQGGPDCGYRLRLAAPRPDFELRVVPASLAARPGGTATLTMFALRKDGFTNTIEPLLLEAPEGFKLSSGKISGTNDQARLTLTFPSTPRHEPISLEFAGRAMVASGAMIRPAVPAEDMMQAFAYRHLVPSETLEAIILGRGTLAPSNRADSRTGRSPVTKARKPD